MLILATILVYNFFMPFQFPLTSDLLNLGVQPGEVLLVHSSLRALGPIPGVSDPRGGAEAVVQSLLEALGPQGTLLMPALSYDTVGAHNPVFDVLHTPSCVGALPEYFRTRPGTMRSVHPTHSVCGVGRRSVELLKNHVQDKTPVGSNSPFARLPKIGGHLLFLGCGLRPNTSMHGVEEHVVPPYLYGPDVDYTVTLADGSQIAMRVRSHNFKGVEQRYDRLEEVMHRGLRKGRVLQAECFLLDASEAWFAALTEMRVNPLYFVDKVAT